MRFKQVIFGLSLLAAPLSSCDKATPDRENAGSSSQADAASSPDDAREAGIFDSEGCMGTWDCPEDIAQEICAMTRDCIVCVQAVDAQGTPIAWGALEDATKCACPVPYVER